MPCDSPSLTAQSATLKAFFPDVDRIKSEGFELVKLKNLWTEEQYKGINSQWRRPETGLRFEVQFHTPESLEAKELTHKAYERIRGPASPAERSELEDYPTSGERAARHSPWNRRDQRLPGEAMTDKITYYAIIDEHTSRDRPSRRCFAVSRMTKVRRRDILAQTSNGSSHRCCIQPSAATPCYDFVPIGEEEAERIVARIRGVAASEE